MPVCVQQKHFKPRYTWSGASAQALTTITSATTSAAPTVERSNNVSNTLRATYIVYGAANGRTTQNSSEPVLPPLLYSSHKYSPLQLHTLLDFIQHLGHIQSSVDISIHFHICFKIVCALNNMYYFVVQPSH